VTVAPLRLVSRVVVDTADFLFGTLGTEIELCSGNESYCSLKIILSGAVDAGVNGGSASTRMDFTSA
jgi:hypothetical protein